MTATSPSPVRLLTLCGSLQRRSANRAALAVAAEVGTAHGASVDDFDRLRDLPAFDPDLSDTPGPAVEDWRRRVGAAHVVLVAAPEYAGAPTGAVKNAFDWLVGSGELYRKPVAVLSAGTSGGEHARRMLAQTLTWQGAYVVATLGIAAPRTKSDELGRLRDESTLAEIASLTRTLLLAPSLRADEVVALATGAVGALGVDLRHLSPRGSPPPATGPLDVVIATDTAVRVVAAGPERDRYLPLLSLADDSAEQVRAYYQTGTLFALDTPGGEPIGTILAVTAADGAVELKAVAVSTPLHGRGVGTRLLGAVVEHLRAGGTRRVVVGTSSSGIGQLAYYQKAGFRLRAVERDFFTPDRGYPGGIEENGIPLRDMVWMDQEL